MCGRAFTRRTAFGSSERAPRIREPDRAERARRRLVVRGRLRSPRPRIFTTRANSSSSRLRARSTRRRSRSRSRRPRPTLARSQTRSSGSQPRRSPLRRGRTRSAASKFFVELWPRDHPRDALRAFMARLGSAWLVEDDAGTRMSRGRANASRSPKSTRPGSSCVPGAILGRASGFRARRPTKTHHRAKLCGSAMTVWSASRDDAPCRRSRTTPGVDIAPRSGTSRFSRALMPIKATAADVALPPFRARRFQRSAVRPPVRLRDAQHRRSKYSRVCAMSGSALSEGGLGRQVGAVVVGGFGVRDWLLGVWQADPALSRRALLRRRRCDRGADG